MNSSSKNSVWHAARFLFPFMKPHALWALGDILGCSIFSICPVAYAFLLGTVIEAALAGNYDVLIKSIIFMTLLIAVNASGLATWLFCYASLASFTVRDIRNSLVKKLGRIPVSFTENIHSGDFVSRFSSDTWSIQYFFETVFNELVVQPLIFVVVSIYMFFVDYRMFILCITLVPVSMFVANWLSKPVEKQETFVRRQWGKVNYLIADTIGGAGILKAFNLYKPLTEGYEDTWDHMVDEELKLAKRESYIAPLQTLISILPSILCILLGGYLTIKGQMTIKALIISLQLLRYAADSAGAIPGLMFTARRMLSSVDRLSELMEYEEESNGKEVASGNPNSDPIEFKNVTFSYDGKTHSLNNMDFVVQKGKMTALVGPSGTGKSTVFKLLCRFYEHQAGEVLLFGKEVKDWNVHSLRKYLSLVSQETYLYPTTIEENIAYGKPGASSEEIINAARMANAHEFIIDFPEGYSTMVGERGVRLSGGQKQRIAIARAILKDAPILLLDEPTSALDNQAEAIVQETLNTLMKGRTVLAVAHRLSTIKDADIILVMDEGKIVESGSHEELFNKGGLYSQLYLKQMSLQEAQ